MDGAAVLIWYEGEAGRIGERVGWGPDLSAALRTAGWAVNVVAVFPVESVSIARAGAATLASNS